MITLDNFLLTFTLLLFPFKLSGFNNIALNCFFNAGTQIMFSTPFIHHIHFQLYKQIRNPKERTLNWSAYNAADGFINLLPDYYTGNTTQSSHNIKADRNLEYYLRELYKDSGLTYGDEGDTLDPLFEYFHLFDTLVPKNLTKNLINNTIFKLTQKVIDKEYKYFSLKYLNLFYLDNKHVKTIKNGGKFEFGMFLERFKDFISFEKNIFVFFGENMMKNMTKEFLVKMFRFEAEVKNWNGRKVKVGLSLHGFDKSAADLRTGVAIHYWAYVYKNNKWYVGNDKSLNEVKDIKSEMSSYRHHVFRFSVDYIKKLK